MTGFLVAALVAAQSPTGDPCMVGSVVLAITQESHLHRRQTMLAIYSNGVIIQRDERNGTLRFTKLQADQFESFLDMLGFPRTFDDLDPTAQYRGRFARLDHAPMSTIHWWDECRYHKSVLVRGMLMLPLAAEDKRKLKDSGSTTTLLRFVDAIVTAMHESQPWDPTHVELLLIRTLEPKASPSRPWNSTWPEPTLVAPSLSKADRDVFSTLVPLTDEIAHLVRGSVGTSSHHAANSQRQFGQWTVVDAFIVPQESCWLRSDQNIGECGNVPECKR